MSCKVWLSACPMCSSPVMFGGGRQIVYFGFLLCGSATNKPSDSQRAYQPASMACGSNALGISLMGACFIIRSESRAPARRSLLAQLSRRGYGYALVSAHVVSNLSVYYADARPALRSV